MKQLLILLITLIVAVNNAISQTTITGIVSDVKGNGIPGANVFIKDTYDGGTSDVNGQFSFTTTETGEHILSASFLGFETWEQKIKLDTTVRTIRIKLKETVNELKAVTIAAGAFEASDEKKMVILRPLDIVTTAGAGGDIYGAIQTLPGTGVVGEKEGLYVRGGDASETKTFIDGLMVDNPYYSSVPDVPQRGRFSPFLFKGTSFSSGGYSAQYGQAMSSALILESQDMPDKSSTNIGIMSVGASLGHTKKWKKTAIGVFGSYTDLTPYYAIVKQNRDWPQPPRSANGSFLLRRKTSETGMLKAFFSYSYTHLVVMFPDTTDPLLERMAKFKQDNGNLFSSINYKEIIFKSWTVYAAASYSMNTDKIYIDELPVNNTNNLFASRLTLSHTIGDLSVWRFGGEFQRAESENENPFYRQPFNESYSAIYAEGDIYITPKLVSRLGVRGEYSKVIERMNIAPRASLAYKTGQYSQLSFAYGDFYQSPPKNIVLSPAAADLKYERATHFILNYQYISDYRTFRIETYYKDYNDLSKQTNTSYNNSGYGHARGIEFFYRDKKTISKSDFWISYSYLDTKRLYLDFPIEAAPVFAANHTASIVYKYFIPKISLAPGLTYVYSSGRPYYNPNNPAFLSDRTKEYHNLSINFSYLTSIKKNFAVVVFSIGNLLGIDNVFTYTYSSDGSHRAAVGPTADRMYFAGIFINIGSQADDSDKFN